MNDFFAETLLHLSEVCVTLYFCTKLLTPRFSRHTVYTVWLCGLLSAYLFTYNIRDILEIRGPFMQVCEIIIIMFCYRDRLRRRIFVNAQVIILTLFGELFAIVCHFLLTGSWTPEFTDVVRRICSILYLIIFSYITPIAVVINKRTGIKQFLRIFVIQTLLCVSQIAYIWVLLLANKTITAQHLFVLTIVAVVPSVFLNLFFTYAIDTAADIQKQKRESEFAREKDKLEYSYYEMALDNEQRLSTLRHEIANTVQNAVALVESGEKQKGIELISALNDAQKSAKRIVYCDNGIINIILAVKAREMSEKSIECEINVSELPENIPLTGIELSSVLTNIIDNAIEACSLCEGGRKIAIAISEKQKNLVIRVENTYNGVALPSADSLTTTKSDKRLHGFGIKAIKQIALNHSGQFELAAADGKATATFIAAC